MSLDYEWIQEMQADPYIMWRWSICLDILDGVEYWFAGHSDGADWDWKLLPANWECI